jgi:hypothetical protein
MRCNGTNFPLLTALFLFFLSAGLLFSQKGLSKGFEILHGVLSHKKSKIWGKKNILGDPPCPPGDGFFRFFSKKKLKSD